LKILIETNPTFYVTICFYIIVEKYGQSMLGE